MDDGGSAGETTSVDDVDDIAQMPQVHGAALAPKAIMDPPIGPTVNLASRSAPECSCIPSALPVSGRSREAVRVLPEISERTKPSNDQLHSNDRNRFRPTVEEHANERCCNEALQLPEVGLGSK
jgi:hypothetical protein